MPRVAKGVNKIAVALHDWDEDDRQEAIDYALHPGNGTTSIMLFLRQRNIVASLTTVQTWKKSLIEQSERVSNIRAVIDDYKGLEPNEVLSFLLGTLAENLIALRGHIEGQEAVGLKEIQAITSLAKEARSAAAQLNVPQSTSSMKELELGFVMNAFDKLELIFEDDEIVLERIKLACKGILTEVEGQYQG
jgi:hypothetical protein